ncbi:MAG: hypothetical protein ACREKQ_14565, partial [Candidatus Rokuibacteriota bacterium]
MDPNQAIALVERCPPLATLSRAAKLHLAEVCREVRFEEDERIFSIAKPMRRILILLEGRAKLVGVT